jgi:hypothetical protein
MSSVGKLVPATVVALVILFAIGFGGARALTGGQDRPADTTVTLDTVAAARGVTVGVPTQGGEPAALARRPVTTTAPDTTAASGTGTGTGASESPPPATGGGTSGGPTTLSFGDQ